MTVHKWKYFTPQCFQEFKLCCECIMLWNCIDLVTIMFHIFTYHSPQEAQAYADDNSLLFMETSAKTAVNVSEIFMAIGKWTLADLIRQLSPPARSYRNVRLGSYNTTLYVSMFVPVAKKLPKHDPQGGAGQGGRTRTGVDLQEAAPQSRSSHCCSSN